MSGRAFWFRIDWEVRGQSGYEPTDVELDAAQAAGVDMDDEYAISDWFQKQFRDNPEYRDVLPGLVDDYIETDRPEMIECSPEGEIPERYWGAES